MAIKPDYMAGTITVAENGTVVTGVGSQWVSADIQPGDTLKVKNLDAVIAAVTSNTSLTLAEPWTGGVLAASPYRIRYQPDGSRFTAAARDLIAQLGNGNLQAFSALAGAFDMIPIFTGTGAMTLIAKSALTQGIEADAKVETLAARAAYDGAASGFSVLVNNVGDGRSAIYYKKSATSGDWSTPAYITGPNGSFQSKGQYNPATAYVLGDVVQQNGSSWVARVSTTGNAPPALPATSNTQWYLLSAAGNTFTIKGAYSGATAYLKDDVVNDSGSSWIALQSTTGNAPPTLPTTANAYWNLLSSKGNDAAVIGALVPQGRLTLTSGTAITTVDAVGQTSVYYTPCTGNRIPIFNGTDYVNTVFSELTLALDPTSGHANYHISAGIFDCFVFNDAGTIRLGTGPSWSVVTAGLSVRGTGAGTTELENFNGFWVNKNSIVLRFGSATGNTVTIPARQATFVGSIRMTANGQTGDSQALRYVANAYNKASRLMFLNEATPSWVYSTATWRQVNGSALNRLAFLIALPGDLVEAHASARVANSTTTARSVQTNIGLNQTTAPGSTTASPAICDSLNFGHPTADYIGYPPIGLNLLNWLEIGAGADTQTFVSLANRTGITGSVQA